MKQPITLRNTGIKITDVLDMVAKAHAYDQIVHAYPQLTISDIMVAAGTASQIIKEMVDSEEQITVDAEMKLIARNGKLINLTSLQKTHPRAYEPWSKEEQEQLVSLFQQGKTIKELSEALERRPGAIQARLKQIGLIKTNSHKEPAEAQR